MITENYCARLRRKQPGIEGFSSAATNNVQAMDTPIGRLPGPADLDTNGLDLPAASLARLLSVDVEDG